MDIRIEVRDQQSPNSPTQKTVNIQQQIEGITHKLSYGFALAGILDFVWCITKYTHGEEKRAHLAAMACFFTLAMGCKFISLIGRVRQVN